jgi:hypothetical protein
VHQSQQIQSVAKESQNEARRLASAIETLNGDRDRLYARVTVLEQGLDSATGAIARQNPTIVSPQAAAPAAATEPQPASQNTAAATVAAPAPPSVAAPASAPTSASSAAPATAVSALVATTPVAPTEKPVAETTVREQAPAKGELAKAELTKAEPAKGSSVGPTASTPPTPATPLVASKSIMAPPDGAAGKLIRPESPGRAVTSAPMPEVVASVSSEDAEPDASQASSKVAVQRTEFGVDVGGANSLGGLRALWRGLLKSNSALAPLRPVIAVKENRNGLGLQLRLIAGPISDAAAAAKICATLTESERSCETTVFDGQRLAMKAEEPPASVVKPAPVPVSAARRRGTARRGVVHEEAPRKPDGPALSSLFSKRQ